MTLAFSIEHALRCGSPRDREGIYGIYAFSEDAALTVH